MVVGQTMLLEVGAIMLIAFIGAAIAKKARQSVILGYILAGILIGPHMHLVLGPFIYDGLFHDTAFIEFLSEMGLILLMFFVGLEFSVSKLKKTKAPATLLAVLNLGVNMFAGIVLGMAMGWPLVDTIFLAGVVAMSSSAVTAKSLMELDRMQNTETEYLLGMVIVEDFLAMALLTIVGGLVVEQGAASVGLVTLAVGIIAFYAFFVVLALWVIPNVMKNLNKIKNDELFVLFALGVVFLSAALAEISHVPGIIGAFFLGMVFAETKLSKRFEEKISPFRDAFVAIFFISFGMLIDPAMFSEVIWMVAIAVLLVIINDVFITAALAYFLGFSSRGSTALGTSLCGRGAESIMYASVGSRALGATKGAQLYPFAGAFCFIMSAVTPLLMKKSAAISGLMTRILPRFIKYNGAVLSRTISKMVMPSRIALYKRPRKLGIALIVSFFVVLTVLATTGTLHLVSFGIGLGTVALVWPVLNAEIRPIILHTDYRNLGVASGVRPLLFSFVSKFIISGLMLILGISFVLVYSWVAAVALLVVYLVLVMALMKRNYGATAVRLQYDREDLFLDKGEILSWERRQIRTGTRNKDRWD